MKERLITAILLAVTVAASCGKRELPVPGPDGSVVVSDRLSNQRVNAFAEDADGHIWIATSRGVNQYSVYEYHQ